LKIGLNEVPVLIENDMIAKADKIVTMIGNNVAVARVLTEQTNLNYDSMMLNEHL